MKKGFISLLFTLSLALSCVPMISFAQESREYTLLAPLPLGQGGTEVTRTDFAGYINGMYRFVLGVAGILAVIMIIYAGFVYMTTDAFQKKQEGREHIKNAILGLLLAISTWLILNTINPNLLQFNFQIQRPVTTVQPLVIPGSGSPDNGAAGPNNQFCTTCSSLAGTRLPLKQGQGDELDAEMIAKLQAFNQDMSGTNWQITEAFPPTTTKHKDQCHYNGTCIDANFTPGTPATATNIDNFISTAAEHKMIAEYEVPTEADRTRLRNEGATGTILVVPGVVPHFSVYNAQAPQTN
ncbi:MAG: hypothetical protein COV34_03545 [Candidatus Zambryskibacteria bacterium CG10_big_fil_rev_8_21_14_0_10_42_12]|uniref:Uncharacterized protein n=1 Tax=Candidatus Zambryskibacteria bacterium CG10_big_fil_rev_8_21_14_0_10_42_12 TaxID=1975115 RepID=A0A2H0QSH5_9BACT|nr:MAG: hypothetical protein COV34_03545 [Candidatus Zambryskibacteria bacterium CG10_big_fil_rev_8_21_14_0_10_42_12]